MTAYENMAFALRLRKRPKGEIDGAVRRAAAMLGLGGLLDRKPRQLSGGECQRVALGRAVVREPACFLLDEPLSNLDARLRLQLRAEIKRLHRRIGTTTIYVTHDQEDALTLGDRVAVMAEGRIHQIGTPQDVYRHPANRFVAGFLGGAPMNFLDGVIAEHEGRLWLDAAGQRIAVPDWAAPDLRARVGSAVVLGVRPEAVCLDPLPGQAGNAIRAKVELADMLGEVADVHLSTPGGACLVARLGGRVAPRAAAPVQVYVNLDQLHFFQSDRDDAEPGANLCLAAERRRA
jgi:multiple sugar transport system ATP-binding protein